MSIIFNYTFQVVVVAVTLLGAVCGVLGSFAVLRKQSLLGDGVAHSTLPGVVLAFMLGENLLLGGVITGVISALLIMWVTNTTGLKFDSVLALVMSVFFGLGLVLLTYVQKLENTTQVGLERFIYGQASGMLLSDVKLIAYCSLIILVVVGVFWKEFKFLTFDREFAKTVGYNTAKLDLLLTILTVTVIMIGLQTVGVILISAMLIAPAVGARQWANSLHSMVIISACFGAISGIVGTIASSYINNLPTGPVIVITATIITLSSIVVAPRIKKEV